MFNIMDIRLIRLRIIHQNNYSKYKGIGFWFASAQSFIPMEKNHELYWIQL